MNPLQHLPMSYTKPRLQRYKRGSTVLKEPQGREFEVLASVTIEKKCWQIPCIKTSMQNMHDEIDK